MSEQPEHGIKTLVPLDEGCVPIGVIEIVEYLNPEGQRMFGYRHNGTDSVACTLGLIELAKRKVIQTAYFADED